MKLQTSPLKKHQKIHFYTCRQGSIFHSETKISGWVKTRRLNLQVKDYVLFLILCRHWELFIPMAYSTTYNGWSSSLKRRMYQNTWSSVNPQLDHCCFFSELFNSSLRGEDHLQTTERSLKGCPDPTFLLKYRPCSGCGPNFPPWNRQKYNNNGTAKFQMSFVRACRFNFEPCVKETKRWKE